MCFSSPKPNIPNTPPPIQQAPADLSAEALAPLLIGSHRKKGAAVDNTSGYGALQINLGSLPQVSGLTIGQG